MKTKFEETVANQIPRTQNSAEPELPWKLDQAEIDKLEPGDEELKAALTQAPPLHVRGSLLVLLLATIFLIIINTVINIYVDKTEMQVRVLSKEKQVVMLKTDLVKTKEGRKSIEENAAMLEKRVSDLTAQKDLYTAVIETLARKSDELPAQSQVKEAPKPSAPAQPQESAQQPSEQPAKQ